jgi:hypothetical protein
MSVTVLKSKNGNWFAFTLQIYDPNGVSIPTLRNIA